MENAEFCMPIIKGKIYIQLDGLNHALVNLIVIVVAVVAVLFAVYHFPRPPTGQIHSYVCMLLFPPLHTIPFLAYYIYLLICYVYVGNRKAATATDKSQKQISEICLLTHTQAGTHTHAHKYIYYVYAPHLAPGTGVNMGELSSTRGPNKLFSID